MAGLGELIASILTRLNNLDDNLSELQGIPSSSITDISNAVDALTTSLLTAQADISTLEDDYALLDDEVNDNTVAVSALNAAVTALESTVQGLLNEKTARASRDATTSVTLGLDTHRIFSKTITSNRQWLLSGEKTGDEFTIYCPAGSGSLNAQLFAITGKSPTIHAKIDTYVNTKPAIITGKILFSDASNFTIAYFVTQPLA